MFGFKGHFIDLTPNAMKALKGVLENLRERYGTTQDIVILQETVADVLAYVARRAEERPDGEWIQLEDGTVGDFQYRHGSIRARFAPGFEQRRPYPERRYVRGR